VAAAIGAIGITALVLSNTPPDDPAPVGTTPPTTVPADPTEAELATDWVSCVLGDCASGAVLATATIDGQPAPDYSAFRVGIEPFDVAATCEGEETVLCTVTGSDLVRETFGSGFNEVWQIEIEGDAVVSAFVESEDSATMDAYEAWLESTYPDEMASAPFTGYAPWVDHVEEFMESDAWVRPYEIDIVGTWEMLKGEIWTFSADGIYTVADRNGVYETGNYSFDEPNITIQAGESNACPTQVGIYELRFFSADRFGWVLVEDECGIRGSLLNGLADRAE
jgi:hypothetical protein